MTADDHNPATGPPRRAGPVHPGHWVTLLGALAAMGAVSLNTYLPALPQLTADLHATPAQTQLTVTACMLGLAVGQLIAGPISDRTGRRPPLITGLLAFAAMSVLCAASGSIELLTGWRLGQGIAGGVSIVLSRAIVRDLFVGDALVRVFASVMIVLGAGPILAPIVGAQLLIFTDWRGTFLALAALALVLAAIVALWMPETLPHNQRRTADKSRVRTEFHSLAKDSTFVLSTVGSSLAGAAFFVYLAASSFILQGIFGLSPQLFSVVFAVNAVGFIAAGQANRPLMTTFSAATRLLLGVAVCLAGGLLLIAALLPTDPPLPVVLGGFLAVTAGYGFASPNGATLAMADQQSRAGSAAALFGLAQYGMGAVVVALGGLAGVYLSTAACLITGLTAAALLSATMLRRRIHPPRRQLVSRRVVLLRGRGQRCSVS